jgi:hypothetical protein
LESCRLVCGVFLGRRIKCEYVHTYNEDKGQEGPEESEGRPATSEAPPAPFHAPAGPPLPTHPKPQTPPTPTPKHPQPTPKPTHAPCSLLRGIGIGCPCICSQLWRSRWVAPEHIGKNPFYEELGGAAQRARSQRRFVIARPRVKRVLYHSAYFGRHCLKCLDIHQYKEYRECTDRIKEYREYTEYSEFT